MFDIGFSELIVIALVALIVFGPKRLPEMARTAGLWMGRLRRFMENVKQDLDREMSSADLAEFKRLQEELAATRDLVQRQGANTLGLITRQDDSSASEGEGAPALPAPDEPAVQPAKPVKKRATKKRTTKKRASSVKAAVPKDAAAESAPPKDHGENS